MIAEPQFEEFIMGKEIASDVIRTGEYVHLAAYAKKNNVTISVSYAGGQYRVQVSPFPESAGVVMYLETITSADLDRAVAQLGSKLAFEYAAKHTAQQMRDRENFFRGV